MHLGFWYALFATVQAAVGIFTSIVLIANPSTNNNSDYDGEEGVLPRSSDSSTPNNNTTKLICQVTKCHRRATECSITCCDTIADVTSIVIIITPCDIGNAVWVDYSCILSLVQSLLRQSSSFPKDIHSTGDDDYVKEEQ
mmetsp:Transcript_27860/g.40734  ORF Transcript_27860/g.40734 Transcript_27860/m.40734 type:complete len:140 (+) Transcript_27860:479-898(+)